MGREVEHGGGGGRTGKSSVREKERVGGEGGMETVTVDGGAAAEEQRGDQILIHPSICPSSILPSRL